MSRLSPWRGHAIQVKSGQDVFEFQKWTEFDFQAPWPVGTYLEIAPPVGAGLVRCRGLPGFWLRKGCDGSAQGPRSLFPRSAKGAQEAKGLNGTFSRCKGSSDLQTNGRCGLFSQEEKTL